MTVTAPGPYEAKISRADAPAGGYRSAEQELADALEGQAPRLAHDVAGLLGPARTAQLAQVIHRAVAVGIKRRADQETADRLTGVYDLLFDGLNQITECTTGEDEDSEQVPPHPDDELFIDDHNGGYWTTRRSWDEFVAKSTGLITFRVLRYRRSGADREEVETDG